MTFVIPFFDWFKILKIKVIQRCDRTENSTLCNKIIEKCENNIKV